MQSFTLNHRLSPNIPFSPAFLEECSKISLLLQVQIRHSLSSFPWHLIHVLLCTYFTSHMSHCTLTAFCMSANNPEGQRFWSRGGPDRNQGKERAWGQCPSWVSLGSVGGEGSRDRHWLESKGTHSRTPCSHLPGSPLQTHYRLSSFTWDSCSLLTTPLPFWSCSNHSLVWTLRQYCIFSVLVQSAMPCLVDFLNAAYISVTSSFTYSSNCPFWLYDHLFPIRIHGWWCHTGVVLLNTTISYFVSLSTFL